MLELRCRSRPALRTVILGAGKAGKLFSNAARQLPEVDVVGVVSRDGRSAAALAERHGATALQKEDDWTLLKPDLVLIATPHYLHVPQIQAALDIGAAVVCDKPLALDRSGLNDISRAQERTAGHVFCGFTQRCSRSMDDCRKYLRPRRRQIRQVVCTQHLHREPSYYAGWKGSLEHCGGGVGINQAIHAVDLGIYLSGASLEVIDALAIDSRGLGVEDTLMAGFKSQDGWPFLLSATTNALKEERQTIRVDLNDVCVLIVGSETPVWSIVTDDVQLNTGRLSRMPDLYGPGHKELLRDVVATILGRTPPLYCCDLIGVSESHLALFEVYEKTRSRESPADQVGGR